MKFSNLVALIGGGAVVLAVLGLAVQSFLGQKRPDHLGLDEGTLRACPKGAQNCVCSERGETTTRVEPLRLAVGAHTAAERIAEVIGALPRTQVVRVEADYLHAEYTSLVFRFVDDLEVRIDPDEGTVHVRSASRVGKGDLGANRRRVEELRRRLHEAGICA